MIHNIIALNDAKTIGELCQVFVDFAKTSPKESDAHRLFHRYVKRIALAKRCSEIEAKQIARSNIRWYTGYYDEATQQMIYSVYGQMLRSR